MKVLLAGTARSGSTWAANVLGRAAGARSVYEPDGPISDVLGAMVARRLGEFPVLAADERSAWYQLVWELAFTGGWPWDRVESARAAGRRLVKVPPQVRDYIIAGLATGTSHLRRSPEHVIVKSVNSAFTLEWIERHYAPKVVVLRRNPLNVVSSWVVLHTWTDEAIRTNPFVERTYLRPLGLKAPARGSSPVRIAAWNVGLLTTVLKQTSAEHPEWIVASHDDLCIDPVTKFHALIDRIGLQWTPDVERYLHNSDDPRFTVHGGSKKVHPNAVTATTDQSRREQQSTQFKRRLTPDQTAEARAILNSFPLEDWGPPN
jgi:hypothetical protein